MAVDGDTLGAVLALVKNIPGTAANAAVEAAEEARASAEAAATHNYGISVSGTALVITPPTGT